MLRCVGPGSDQEQEDDHVVQVKDGNIVIGSSQTLIQGLAQEARVTKANEQGLVLGFEVQDGPKSMVDIVLGKVSSLLVPTASILLCTLRASRCSCCLLSVPVCQ